MSQEQDLMSTMKRLKRVNQEGGTMTPEERAWFEHTKKASQKLEAQAKVILNSKNILFTL